jgi:hypothetical protein
MKPYGYLVIINYRNLRPLRYLAYDVRLHLKYAGNIKTDKLAFAIYYR